MYEMMMRCVFARAKECVSRRRDFRSLGGHYERYEHKKN